MNPERTRHYLNVLSVEEVLALLDLKADKGAIRPCCCCCCVPRDQREGELNRRDAETQRGREELKNEN